MTLRKTIEVVTKLSAMGAIGDYAIAGAVAALNYIQPTLTEDLDILISIEGFGKHRSDCCCSALSKTRWRWKLGKPSA